MVHFLTYDYMAINFTSVAGFIFLLIFLHANSTLDKSIKQIYYTLVLIEFVEMLTYSLELWTTTFETLSPLRLWLSAIGYSIRPFIFCLMLKLAVRPAENKRFPRLYYLPAILNVAGSFSVFFTGIVYSYTQTNQFVRGPLGYLTHIVVIIYLFLLTWEVVRSHAGRSKLETLIIFAISTLLIFSMVIEAVFLVRTIGRASIILVTIFYYMFFQTNEHNNSFSREQSIRQQLEYDSMTDPATGALNKKAFADAAKSIMAPTGKQPPARIGFIFLDMDYLKTINDTLGHEMGDHAISDTAAIIRGSCRNSDLLGRFGGNEFCAMLPNIPRQRFEVLLNGIQQKMYREYSAGDTKVAVTASMGAVYSENISALTYEHMVRCADKALYEAKASGRNCFVLREI